MKVRGSPLSSVDLGMQDVAASQIDINHRLTAYMKNIDKHARKAKKDGYLKYVWPKNGIIHGRVADGSPTLNFLRVADVLEVTSNPTPILRPGKNLSQAVEASVMSIDGQLEDASSSNPNSRVPKRKTSEELASSAITDPDDISEDNQPIRSSQRVTKKTKKEPVKNSNQIIPLMWQIEIELGILIFKFVT